MRREGPCAAGWADLGAARFVPEKGLLNPSVAILTVMVPVAVPSAAAVTRLMTLGATAVTFCSPFKAVRAPVTPSTRTTACFAAAWSVGNVAVATPPDHAAAKHAV